MKNIFTFVKKLMSKYIHYIYALLFGGLLIATVISFHKNNALEARIKTLNKISPTASSEKTFKEDYYITQQSNDTTLILTCFGLGFALFSFFTYQSVVGSVADEVSRMKKNYKAHKNDYNIQHNRVIKIEKDLLLQMAYYYKDKAISHYSKGEKSNCINASIVSCEQFCKLLDLIPEDDKTYFNTFNLTFHEMIKSISTVVSASEDDLIFKDYSETHFKTRTELILNHLKGDAYYSFYNAVKKIKFELIDSPFVV